MGAAAREVHPSRPLQRPHQRLDDADPRGVGDDQLSRAGLEGEDLQLFAVDPNQPAEGEAAGGARHEDIPVPFVLQL